MKTIGNMDALDQKTDAELNEIFAVEVAGWHKEPNKGYGWHWHDGEGRFADSPYDPLFSTDANAVLPWLEKHKCAVPSWASGSWSVTIYDETGEGETYDMPILGDADDKSFARAACIALIRAKRAQKPA